ncbi:MAG: DNA mismatch repair protein MutS [Methanothrix sp.]|jgi:DNA mismatch repair protein MutS|uniref:DNA mismatch repair protein MutS n=1 Tax=Methanothrix harundinacea TaxID=301375 RepID=A0A117LFE6_9EURY|nr:MAG: DNA mismatch repair protein MutS [Methanothrix harundinacea]MDD3709097.1 DNA mismatch repair protein MutS [Methanothrix sp.]MDI9400278.1 DNA mismatch repair protein MutS [Euryarchaeota archaeon]KUK96965.1 MAG: DNA mismatch repair protein MutS [Methanothrix harundinacea]MCP1392827.1 DNA mismatch repair protein MutS [Methanothrix harundinacea]
MVKISPLMDQYFGMKEKCGDAVLLFRMGDFYETFGADAEIAARILNITLTSRQKDKEGNRIPLAGIPYHALDAYLPKLVGAGYKVAICEQVEDPKRAKGLVKREIIRVITPGTIIEPSMLEEGSNNYLASIFEGDGRIGLSFLDVSTGEFLATELLADEGKLSGELAKFQPAECLIARSADPQLLGDGVGASVQRLEDAEFDLERAKTRLANHFSSTALDKSGLMKMDPTMRACGAILSYLESAHLAALDHISEIRLYSPKEFMVLDETTLRNLEIFRNIRDRTKRGSLLEFFDETSTPMGSRTLQKWLQMPLVSPEKIEDRLDTVEELVSRSLLRTELREALRGGGDLERVVARTSCGTASPKDLVALKSSLDRLPQIVQLLGEVKSSRLADLKERLDLGSLRELVELIGRAIRDDPPSAIREGGVIRDGYDPELDDLRSLLREGRGWISQMEREERNRTGIKSLRVGYNNVFGYYIEVTKANLSAVPPEYIRKQTLAGAERFITPELKEMESKVLSAQERSTSLEEELFLKIRVEVAGRAREIQERSAASGELDVFITLAVVAAESEFSRPKLNNAGEISMRGCRHPILDRAMRGSFVPNDVHLDGKGNRFLILTGPNMAGKSTYMRQIALAVILAQMGSFVPASFASISPVDRIFTRVGAYDDLTAGQSTFMIEMTELAKILSSATSKSLILLDEIGRGTSTFDGLAIAWSITEHIHNKVRGKAIFATHYHQLTQLAEVLSGVKNYNMAVKEEGESVVFLRTVVPGATDRSYGIHVAKLAGVPEEVVARATKILKEIERDAVIEPLGNGPRSRKKGPKYTQLIFFDEPGARAREDDDKEGCEGDDRDGFLVEGPSISDDSCDLLDEIRDLDLDVLTPLEALNMLSGYRERLRDLK